VSGRGGAAFRGGVVGCFPWWGLWVSYALNMHQQLVEPIWAAFCGEANLAKKSDGGDEGAGEDKRGWPGPSSRLDSLEQGRARPAGVTAASLTKGWVAPRAGASLQTAAGSSQEGGHLTLSRWAPRGERGVKLGDRRGIQRGILRPAEGVSAAAAPARALPNRVFSLAQERLSTAAASSAARARIVSGAARVLRAGSSIRA
jgi:hypothetical protein